MIENTTTNENMISINSFVEIKECYPSVLIAICAPAVYSLCEKKLLTPYIAVSGFLRTFRRRNGLSSATDGQITWHVFNFSRQERACRHVKIGPLWLSVTLSVRPITWSLDRFRSRRSLARSLCRLFDLADGLTRPPA